MSIIWCGGEPIDFKKNTVASLKFGNSSTYYRPSMSRGGIQLGDGGGPYYSNTFTPVSSGIWLHWFMYHQSIAAIDVDCFPISLCNSVTGDAIGVGFDTNEYWSIGKRTSDGTVTWFVSENSKTFNGDCIQYDLHIDTYGSNGIISFYVDGHLLLTYSGDIRVGTTTNFDQVMLRVLDNNWSTFISEIIVADEDTRLMSLKTLAPNAAGDTNQWTGAYTDIDDIIANDADTVYTNVVEQDVQFNLTGMPAGNFICKGVKIIARSTDSTGDTGMQMGIKTNGAVHLGDTIILEGTWNQYEVFYDQNPETISQFTPVEIDALQLAFKSKSTA